MDYMNALIMEFSRAYKVPTEHIEQVYEQAKQNEESEPDAYWQAMQMLKQETRHK